MSQTRRLAAILAADVAGYSRLMGADEEGTLERLKRSYSKVSRRGAAAEIGLSSFEIKRMRCRSRPLTIRS